MTTSPHSPHRRLRATTVSLCGLALLPLSALAADGVFNSVSSTSDWDNTGRWVGGIVANGVGATADFSTQGTTSTSFRSVRVNLDLTLGRLILGDPTGENLARWEVTTLTGHTLTFNNGSSPAELIVGPGSLNATTQLGNPNTFQPALTVLLASDLKVMAATSTDFAYGSPTSASTAGLKVITNAGTGTGAVTLSGNISDGAGMVAVVQDSATSTLFLSGTNSHSGGTTIRTGTMSVNDPARLGQPSGGLTIENGILAMPNSTASKIFLHPINLTGAATIQTSSSASPIWDAAISGSGSLSKTSSGRLTLTSANTYSGGTAVLNGTLEAINKSGSATGSGAVTVTGGQLAGTGTIAPAGQPITFGTDAEIAVGREKDSSVTGIRTLTLSAASGTVDVSFDPSTTFFFDIADTSNHEQLVFDGISNVSLAGTLKLNFIDSPSFSLGDSIQLVSWGSANVTLTEPVIADLPAPGEGLTWDISQFSTTGTITVVSDAPPHGFAAWYALEVLPPDQRGPLDNPTGDGIPNLLKFALDLDPAVAGSVNIGVSSINVDGTDYPLFTYTRRSNLSDVFLTPEISDDASFSALGEVVVVSETPQEDGTVVVQVRSTAPLAAATHQFLRLRATLLLP